MRFSNNNKGDVIVRTKGGASIHSWSFGISVRCADRDRPLAPVIHEVPSDIAANVFTSVGTVEIGEYREPNYPRVMVANYALDFGIVYLLRKSASFLSVLEQCLGSWIE